MTLTDAAAGAAALWLLFTVVSGLPATRQEHTPTSGQRPAPAALAPTSRVGAMPYSIWYEESPPPRLVTPPLPGGNADAQNVTHHALGTAPIGAIWQPQVLSLTEVLIAPGGELALMELDGSGVIVIQTGWLELAESSGSARLVRVPHTVAPDSDEQRLAPTLAPGDRLSFGPGATIILRNRGESPAQLLTASVRVAPGLAA